MSNDIEKAIFYIDINQEIDRHLGLHGAQHLNELVSKVEHMIVAHFGQPTEDEDDHHPFFLEDRNLYEMPLSSLILSHAIVRKMNIFDLGEIISELDVNVLDYVDSFDGIDCFTHKTKEGQLVDPVTLSAAAVQGLATNTRGLANFKGVANHSYMRFAALIASGGAGQVFTSVFQTPNRSKQLKLDCKDIGLGMLTYLNSLDHLPNRSIDQFLTTSGVLENEVLIGLHPSESGWEQMICNISGGYEESALSKAILEKLFSEQFLAENRDKVACLLNNLVDIPFFEYDQNPASYRDLVAVVERSGLKDMLTSPHIMLNMAGDHILKNRVSHKHLELYRPLLDQLDVYGPELLNAALEKAIEIPDTHVGMAILKLPHTIHLFAQSKPQNVSPELAVKYFAKVLEPYQRWLKSNAYEAHFKEDKPVIASGLSYLLGLPGVQASMSAFLRDLDSEQIKLFVGLGLDIKNIKNLTDEVATTVFARDLGL
ncbi:hypothetical protein [Pseudomonas amygdali]|uniref:Uncharacterized protein n=3 Tax=Pseudomonas amygdali TaxID=47877 RepID=A0ABR5KT64_PSEAV|nr:hypothetical protein [Pseudomonas amygdali]AXH60162.1 hypothetical protein PLA107_033795 [Pseudomonas amygdali pv. lachrymans str. M301315]KPC17564.1 Uncharacterized protein AC499_0766 [Pseudomonas amygdali pv. lachrymans]